MGLSLDAPVRLAPPSLAVGEDEADRARERFGDVFTDAMREAIAAYNEAGRCPNDGAGRPDSNAPDDDSPVRLIQSFGTLQRQKRRKRLTGGNSVQNGSRFRPEPRFCRDRPSRPILNDIAPTGKTTRVPTTQFERNRWDGLSADLPQRFFSPFPLDSEVPSLARLLVASSA